MKKKRMAVKMKLIDNVAFLPRSSNEKLIKGVVTRLNGRE